MASAVLVLVIEVFLSHSGLGSGHLACRICGMRVFLAKRRTRLEIGNCKFLSIRATFMRMADGQHTVTALIVAVPETAGSAIYGMIDVLAAAGNLWETLTGSGVECKLISPRIVAPSMLPFKCGNGIPVMADCCCDDDPMGEIVILPEIWLRPEETMKGRYPAITDWVVRSYQRGAAIYSACSGAIMLAETGLLSGKQATSHWGYENLFREQYPDIRFDPAPNLLLADRDGRIVTAGGTTSWHDLALHIISRHCGPAEALRISKVYLLKWHDEGQLPYRPLDIRINHADAVVKSCEKFMADNFRSRDVLSRAVELAAIPERSLKRRFKQATGSTLIEYVQRLRIEEAKHLLETGNLPADEISASVGYEEPAFFRKLFKRMTGLTTGEYRRLFQLASARPH
jgi:transcriptional regulator GlxA family with amidase domain